MNMEVKSCINDPELVFESLETEMKAKILTVSAKEMLIKFEKDILSNTCQINKHKFVGIVGLINTIIMDSKKILEEGSENNTSSYSKHFILKELRKMEKYENILQYLDVLNERHEKYEDINITSIFSRHFPDFYNDLSSTHI